MSVILRQHPKAFRSIPTARHLSRHFSLHGRPIPTACRLLDCSLVHSLSLPPRTPASLSCLPACLFAHSTLLVAAHSPCLTRPFHFPCCPLTFPATPLARFSFPVAAHSPCFLPRL